MNDSKTSKAITMTPQFSKNNIRRITQIAKNSGSNPELVVEWMAGVLDAVAESIKSNKHDITDREKAWAKKFEKLLSDMPEMMSHKMAIEIKSSKTLSIENELKEFSQRYANHKNTNIKPWKNTLASAIEDVCVLGKFKYTTTMNSDGCKLIYIICESLNLDVSKSFALELIKNYKKSK